MASPKENRRILNRPSYWYLPDASQLRPSVTLSQSATKRRTMPGKRVACTSRGDRTLNVSAGHTISAQYNPVCAVHSHPWKSCLFVLPLPCAFFWEREMKPPSYAISSTQPSLSTTAPIRLRRHQKRWACARKFNIRDTCEDIVHARVVTRDQGVATPPLVHLFGQRESWPSRNQEQTQWQISVFWCEVSRR